MRSSYFLLAVSGLAAAKVFGAVPVIYNLGTFPNGGISTGAAISRDGNFATGYGQGVTGDPFSSYAFRWATWSGLTNLGTPVVGDSTFGAAINPTGTVIVGKVGSNTLGRFCRWTQPGGMQDMGLPLGAYQGAASDVSDNGTVIVGTCTMADFSSRGFSWTQSGGYVLLPYSGYDPNILPNTIAYAVSSDGLEIVGTTTVNFQGSMACKWVGNSLQVLGALPSNSVAAAEARAISTNKQVVVGSSDVSGVRRVFRYTNAMVDLGTIPGGTSTTALATNYDGKVIVGTGTVSSYYDTAYYWSTGAGAQNLSTFLASLGTNMTGWVLKEATGVSDDGTAIVGTGFYNGMLRGFVIKGMPCPSVPIIQGDPKARSVCPAPGASATLSVEADGPGQLTYAWSVESPPGSGVFEPIKDAHFADSTGQSFTASGWESPELTITGMRPAPGLKDITFHAELLNPCGLIMSKPARVVLCAADLDCNEMVDDADFVEFVGAYNELVCPGGGGGLPTYCPGDLNSDLVVDDADFVIFVGAYDALLCV